MMVQNSITNLFDLCPIDFEALVSKLAPLFNEGSFADVFSKITQNLKTSSYYFCANTGSFVLVDKEGAAYILIVRSGDELARYVQLARAQKLSPVLIKRIATGRMIPFLGTLENFASLKAADWIINLYSAKKIEAGKSYYYALIGAKRTAALLGENIMVRDLCRSTS